MLSHSAQMKTFVFIFFYVHLDYYVYNGISFQFIYQDLVTRTHVNTVEHALQSDQILSCANVDKDGLVIDAKVNYYR